MAKDGLTQKQENFCLAYVETGNASGAYRDAYDAELMKVTTIRVKASELLADARIQARVQDLRATRQALLDDCFIALKQRVIAEYEKIAFADIRRAVVWLGSLIQEEDNPDGGDVLVIKNIFSNAVRLISSDEIDEDTAAAIAEVSQSPTGGLKVKMHSKPAALDAMVKILGMAIERKELTGKDGAPLIPEAASDRDLARAVLDILRRAKLNEDNPE
jgi:phage terminase small subunit